MPSQKEHSLLNQFKQILKQKTKSKNENSKRATTELEKIKDRDLEALGREVFKCMGLNCFKSKQFQLQQLDNNISGEENCEFDYLIPQSEFCLIGEITSRSDKSDVEKKYKKFCRQVNQVKHYISHPEFWEIFGITPSEKKKFKDVEYILGFFITTQFEADSFSKADNNISVFYKSSFLTLIEYSITIEQWSRPYFLDIFGIREKNQKSIRISSEDNSLIRMRRKKVGSGDDMIPADLYIFETSPYNLLEIAKVYREDKLSSKLGQKQQYQRALISPKLNEIRQRLLTDPEFIFPSNILVTLSQECTYNGSELTIPCKYGIISVIDGQHRLFAYANENIQKLCEDDSKILVSGLQFNTDDEREIEKCSVRVFIEVNATQTPIEELHLHLIGDVSPESIAAKIVRNLNNRKKYKNLFEMAGDGSQTKIGIVKDNPVRKAWERIVNIENIKHLIEDRNNSSRIEGYKNILADSNRVQVADEEILNIIENTEDFVNELTRVFERYLNEVFCVFEYDNFIKIQNIDTSFKLGNFMAGFILLLDTFIDKGMTWEQIKEKLKQLKKNALCNAGLEKYDYALFARNQLSKLSKNQQFSKITPTKKPATIHKFLIDVIES